MKEYISPEFEKISYEADEVLLESEVQETMPYEKQDIGNLY
jgi:hypothetical protein